MKLLSVVFSFRNEEGNIQELVERVHNSLKNSSNWEYELVFVNDDSSDKSENILLKLQKSYPIKIINMSRNFGVDPCVLAGFRHAKGEAVVYLHTDLQDPPELIPELLKKYEDGFDIVHTVRTKRKGETKFRMFVTKVAYYLINILSDINLPIEAGDYKLISKKALEKILNQKEFRPYVRGLSVWVGFKQAYLNYERCQIRISVYKYCIKRWIISYFSSFAFYILIYTLNRSMYSYGSFNGKHAFVLGYE